MNVLRILARIFLVLLIIVTSIQLLTALAGLTYAIGQRPEAISYVLGRCVGALLFLILFVALFRKLKRK